MSADDAAHGPSHLLQPIPTLSTNSDTTQADLSKSSLNPQVKSLTYADLVEVCQALGGSPGLPPPKTVSNPPTAMTTIGSSVDEKHSSMATHPDDEEKQLKSIPKAKTNTPRGLYQRVQRKRKNSQIMYWVFASCYNFCLVLQLVLGASLTALGAADKNKSTAITVLAAANTVNAGCIALMHNSGIPTRYRNDMDEWARVEIYMADIMESGVIQANMNKDDVIATCQEMYNAAFATVENNKPTSYVPTIASAVTDGTTDGKIALARK